MSPAWVSIRARLLYALDVNLTFIDRYHDTLNALSTLAVAIFTATLWSTTRGLYVSGEKQIALANRSAIAAEIAADVARNSLLLSQRAWLKVGFELRERLRESGGNLVCNAQITATNIGNITATEVQFTAHIFFCPSELHLLLKHDEIPSELATRYIKGGNTIFPGDTVPNYIHRFEHMMVSKERISDFTAKAGPEGRPIIGVVGCVDYTFGSDQGNRHQTPFVFLLKMNTGKFVNLADLPIETSTMVVRVPTLGTARQPT